MPESLTLFDFADPSLVIGRALHDQRPVAGAVPDEQPVPDPPGRSRGQPPASGHGDDDARIEAAYLRFLARTPTDAERTRARDFLAGFLAGNSSAKTTDRPRAAWTAFCQALYASAEFRYLD